MHAVTFTDGSTGCSATDSIRLVEIPNPQFSDIITDTTLCVGDSIDLFATALTATDTIRWSWVDPAGPTLVPLSFQVGGDTLFNVDSAGQYLATVTNGSCDTTVTINVNLTDVSASIVAGNDSLCYLDTTLLDGSASASTFGIATYRWDTTGTFSGISGSLADDTLGILPPDPGTYTYGLEVTDSNGCSASTTTLIQMADSISLVFSSDTLSLCNNSAVADSVTATFAGGFTPYAYSWSGSDTTVSLSQTDSATVFIAPNTTGADTVSVMVSMVDAAGCTYSDSVTVIITNFQVASAPQFGDICPGINDSITTTVVTGGIGGYNVQWISGDSLSDSTIFNPIATPAVTSNYQVVVRDSATACSDTASFTINVRSITAEAGGPYFVCPTDTAQLDASASTGAVEFTVGDPHVYAWILQTGDGDTLTGQGSVQRPFVSGGTPGSQAVFALTITDSVGCQATDTAVVNWVAPIVGGVAQDSLIICRGQVDTLRALTATGGVGTLNYEWSRLSGTVVPNTDTTEQLVEVGFPMAIATDTALVQLAVTDSIGCAIFDSMAVIAVDLVVSATSAADTICPGDPTQLNVTVDLGGIGPFTYEWSPSSNLDVDTISNPITTTSTTETYSVVVRDSTTGCSDTATVTVVVRDLVAIIGSLTDPDTMIACFGEDYILDGSATNGGQPFRSGLPYIYDWSLISGDGTGVTGLSSQVSDTISGGTPGTLSVIGLQVTDTVGCTDADTLTLFWNDGLSAVVVGDPYACLNTTDTLTSAVTGGTPGYAYAWEVLPHLGGNLTISGANDQDEVVVTSAVNLDSSYLKLTVTDTLGCTAEDSTLLETRQLLASLVTNFDTVCANATVLLTASDSLALGSVLFDFGSGTQVEDTITLNSISDTTYGVTVIDNATGCTASASVNVTIRNLTVTLNVPDTTLCFEDSLIAVATVTDGNAPYAFNWIVNGSLSLGVNNDSLTIIPFVNGPGAPTAYHLEVVDTNGCTGTSLGDLSSPDFLQVARNHEFVIDAGEDTILCFGADVTLGGAPTALRFTSASDTQTNFDFTWTTSGGSFNSDAVANPVFTPFAGSTAFDVVLEVADARLGAGHCVQYDTLAVDVRDIPVVTMADTTFWCGGDSLFLPVVGQTYPANTTYEWFRNDTLLTADSAFYFVDGVGDYRFLVTDSVGCSNADTTLLDARDNPLVSIEALHAVVCTNADIDLNASYSPVGEGVFTWAHNGLGFIVDEADTATSYVANSADASLRFVATYTTACGTAPDTLFTSAASPPTADFEITDTLVNTNEPIDHINTSLGTDLAFSWIIQTDETTNFTADTEGPHSVSYPEDGQFTSTLMIHDTLTGCMDTTSQSVTVIGTNILFIPNVFSPNATQADNQALFVFGSNVLDSGFEFTVFNRWGEVVYQTNSFSEANAVGWTGVHYQSGDEMSMGVYTYVLKGEFADGTPIERSGSVTLLR